MFCVSLVAAEGNAGQASMVLLAQMAFTLSWVELSLTCGCEASIALLRGEGRLKTVVLNWTIMGVNGKEVLGSCRSLVAHVQG